MSIFQKISSVFADKAIAPKLENAAIAFVDNTFVDKNLEEGIIADLLETYGNEPFYNDFDGYITRNNVINNLIKSVRGNSSLQPNFRTGFIRENEARFLSQYPKYKHRPVHHSQICCIFEKIFDAVSLRINTLNPHSDIGKLQNTIAQFKNESEFRDNRNYALSLESAKKIDYIYQHLSSQQSVADTTKQELIDCTKEVATFTEEIKKIETEYQQNDRMDDALSRYYELLQSITTKLRNQPENQIDALICSLYCNIALCQSNLGDAEKAFKSLNTISAPVAADSKTYHFVYASIIIQHTLSSQYDVAEQHLDRALEIDDAYHRAFLLRQYLYALTSKVDCADNINRLNEHFSSLIEESKDQGLIADFYMQRGLIYQVGGDPVSSEKDFESTLAYVSNSAVAKFNLLAAKYGQAVIKLPRDKRVLFPQIDVKKMLHVKTELEKCFETEIFEKQSLVQVKKVALSLYISACTLLGSQHNLSPVDKYLPFARDYETKRALILGYRGELAADTISLLEDQDRKYFQIRNLLDCEKFSECKEELEKLLNAGKESISSPLLLVLLQVCLILKKPEDYWKYKDVALSADVNDIPFNAFDACAYELSGNIAQAKVLFDNVATTSKDYSTLENTIRFYKRNEFLTECETLYLRVQQLYEENAIVIDDLDLFYQGAISFFVGNQRLIAEDFFNRIEKSSLSEACYYHIKASLSCATNDVPQLLESLNYLYETSHSFQDGFNKALCHRWLLNYDESLSECLVLLNNNPTEDEKVKIFWLISDLYLLKKEPDESYDWAKKAHDLKSNNPYDQSHSAFFGRSFRSGHHEGFAAVLEYKHTHPIVVDWIQEFNISETKNPLESISQQLEKHFPDQKNRQEQERQIASQYKQGIIPINVLLKYYNDDWWRLFQFAAENKLIVSHGNIKRLKLEQELIGDHLVVDAQTLIILAHYDCLAALQSIKHVHITFSSVSTLQYQHLSWNYPQMQSLMDWIQSSNNIVYEADGFIPEDEMLEFFSKDFIAGCNVARKEKIPFLYSDVLAVTFQMISKDNPLVDIDFISIPALCNCLEENQKSQKNQMLYRLLKGCTFISFNADTILEQIITHEFNVSADFLSPFLICKSDYDMESFAIVYLQAIHRLNDVHEDAAISLAKIILDDTFRVWRRGTYYRETAKNYDDSQALEKATRILHYVRTVLAGIKEIFPNDAEKWQQYTELKSIVLREVKEKT